jgi:hypothetical protein
MTGNAERALFPISLGYEHPLDGERVNDREVRWVIS